MHWEYPSHFMYGKMRCYVTSSGSQSSWDGRNRNQTQLVWYQNQWSIHDLRFFLAMETTKNTANTRRDTLGGRNSFKISVLIDWGQFYILLNCQLGYSVSCPHKILHLMYFPQTQQKVETVLTERAHPHHLGA